MASGFFVGFKGRRNGQSVFTAGALECIPHPVFDGRMAMSAVRTEVDKGDRLSMFIEALFIGRLTGNIKNGITAGTGG